MGKNDSHCELLWSEFKCQSEGEISPLRNLLSADSEIPKKLQSHFLLTDGSQLEILACQEYLTT